MGSSRIKTSFRLPEVLFRKFKHLLVDDGRSMNDVLEELVQNWVDSRRSGRSRSTGVKRSEPKTAPHRHEVSSQSVTTSGSARALRRRAEHPPPTLSTLFLRWLPAAAVLRDLKGKLVYANDEYQWLTDRKMKHLVGKLPTDHWPAQVSKTIIEHDEIVRQSGRAILTLEHLDAGQRITIRFPIVEQSALAYTGAVSFDLGAVKRVTEHLLQEMPQKLTPVSRRHHRAYPLADARQLESFMDALPAIAICKDLEGKLRWANPEFERVTRMDRAKIIGNLPMDDWPQEVAERIAAHDGIVRETRTPLMAIDQLPIADALYERLDVRFPIFGEDGNLEMTGALGVDLRAFVEAAASLHAPQSGSQTYLFLSSSQISGSAPL